MITTTVHKFDDLLKVLFDNIGQFCATLPEMRQHTRRDTITRIKCDKKGVYLSAKHTAYRQATEKQSIDITEATLCGTSVIDTPIGVRLDSKDHTIDTSFYIMFYLHPNFNARYYRDFIIYDKYNKCKHPSFTSGSGDNKLFVRIADQNVFGMSYTLHSCLNFFDRKSVIVLDSKCMYLFFDARCTNPAEEDKLVLNNTSCLKEIIRTATRTNEKKIDINLFFTRLMRRGVVHPNRYTTEAMYLDLIDKNSDKKTDPKNLSLQNTWIADCIDVVYDNNKGIFTCSVKP